MITVQKTANQTKFVMETENVNVYYGNFLALKGIYLNIPQNRVTAFIGPSGCGKSTWLRCYNRLNDLIPSFRVEGKITYHGQNLYAKQIDPVGVRRRIGMVFQKPNPERNIGQSRTVFPSYRFSNESFFMRGDKLPRFSIHKY